MQIIRLLAIGAVSLSVGVMAGGALAQQFQVSAYGGWQSAPHSVVEVTDGTSFTAGWEGKSFEAPIYYGLRGTWWLDEMGLPNTGLSIDFSHTKVYSDDETRAEAGYDVLEFTDGLNNLTANLLYRFEPIGVVTPYIGAGAGVVLPHVEVTRPSGTTFEYQYGGPSVQVQAGLSYQFTENWSAFVEYKGNYSWVDVEIDSGDRLATNIVTNAVNLGVSFHF